MSGDSLSDSSEHKLSQSDCESDLGSSEHSGTGLVDSSEGLDRGPNLPCGLADACGADDGDVLTPVERDILDRRRQAMATHGNDLMHVCLRRSVDDSAFPGIGLVVGKNGIEMRPNNYFPTGMLYVFDALLLLFIQWGDDDVPFRGGRSGE